MARATVRPPVAVEVRSIGEFRAGSAVRFQVSLEAAQRVAVRFELLLPETEWEGVTVEPIWDGTLEPGTIRRLEYQAVARGDSVVPPRARLGLPGWSDTYWTVVPEQGFLASSGAGDSSPAVGERCGEVDLLVPGDRGASRTGRLIVKGRFAFEEQDLLTGVRHARVRVWGAGRCSSCNPPAQGCPGPWAEGRTDEQGYFEVTAEGVPQDQPEGAAIYVEALAESPGVTVQKTADGTLYRHLSAERTLAPGELEADFGALVVPATPGDLPDSGEGTEKGAWRLLNTLDAAWEFAREFSLLAPGKDVPPVRAIWPSIDGTWYRPPVAGDEGALFVDPRDGADGRLIWHQYGHHLLGHFAESPAVDYNNGTCDRPWPGYCAWQPEREPIPWIEGWCDYFSRVASVVTGAEPGAGLAISDPEAGIGPADPGESPCVAGDEAERLAGTTTAILWDQALGSADTSRDGREMAVGDLVRAYGVQWDILVGYDPAPDDPHHDHPASLREFWRGSAESSPGTANELSRIFQEHCVPPEEAADLQVAELSAAATSVVAGGTLPVTATAVNRGGIATGRVSETRFLLLPESGPAGAAPVVLGQHLVPTLPPHGGRLTMSALLDVPRGLDAGSYRLGACVDGTGEVFEIREENNCLVLDTTIQVVVLPDLVEMSLSEPPPAVAPGQSLTVFETVRNLDAADAGKSATRFYLSLDVLKDSQDIPLAGAREIDRLTPAQSSSGTTRVTVPLDTPGGEYLLLACADDRLEVPESDEFHNCTASSGRVRILLPDLVTEVSRGSRLSGAAPGRALSLRVTVRNLGETAAGASALRSYLSLDDVRDDGDILLIGDQRVPRLAPGRERVSSMRARIPSGTPEGEYALLACADAHDAVIEKDESNNCAAAGSRLRVVVSNLRPLSVSDPPQRVGFPGGFAITDTVRNEGTTATRPSLSRIYLSPDQSRSPGDILLSESRVVPSLGAGQESSATTNVTIPTPVGTYFVIICADETEAVEETDEDDNCLASTGTVTIVVPNLKEASVTVEPQRVAGGESLTVEDVVRNTVMDTAQAGGSVTRYFLSPDDQRDAGDIVLGTRQVPPLGPAEDSPPSTVSLVMPPATPAGFHYVVACADDDADVSESDESDNCGASDPIEVLAPDLVLVAVAFQEPSELVKPGDFVQLSDTVRNEGESAAGNSTTRFYLSLDDVKDAADILLTPGREVPPLPAQGDPSSGTTPVILPASLHPNRYHVIACADDLGVVFEVTEVNNCLSTSATLEVAGPDLKVTGVSITSDPASPGFVTPGDSIEVIDTVLNDGELPGGMSVTRFYLSPASPLANQPIVPIGSRSVEPLASQQSSQGQTMVMIPTLIAAGTYRILACADGQGTVAEADESNNCQASGGFQIARPDLEAVAVTFSPGRVAAGGTLSVTDTVVNKGPVPAGMSETRYYLARGSGWTRSATALTGLRSVPPLDPPPATGDGNTGSTSVMIPADVAAGDYFLLACANDTGLVIETERSNNCVAAQTRLTLVLPDLVMRSVLPVTEIAPPLLPGGCLSVRDTVENEGEGPAGESLTRFYLSADETDDGGDVRLVGSRMVTSLGSGEFSAGDTEACVPVDTAPGSYSLLACANDARSVRESDEGNNCRPMDSAVEIAGADLLVSAIIDYPPLVALGESFDVTDTTRNTGMVAAGPSVTRFYFSGDSVKSAGDVLLNGSRVILALGPSEESTQMTRVMVPSTLSTGPYYLLACADDTGVVAESDEDNNCQPSLTAVQIQAPDLVVASLADPPAFAAPGSTFEASHTVQNAGTAPAGMSVTRFYLSVDRMRSPDDARLSEVEDVPALDAGAASSHTTVVTVPITLAFGAYYLLACADDTGVVAESDEGDNCEGSLTAVQIQAPDLVVTSLADPPPYAAPGNAFEASHTVQNAGTAPAGASVTRFYLSMDQARSPDDARLSVVQSVPLLDAGTASSHATVVTVPISLEAGTYYLLTCADDTGVVAESDEDNNCRTSSGVMVQETNLVMISISDPPPSLPPGSQFAVTDTVRNASMNVPAGPTVTRFYLSLGQARSGGDVRLLEARSVPAVAPGEESSGTTSVTIPVGVIGSTYYLLACANDTLAVGESDTGDNCLASAGTVMIGPDLRADVRTVEPAEAAPGEGLIVTSLVRNEGNVMAGVSVAHFYLSSDAIEDSADRRLIGSGNVQSLGPGESGPEFPTLVTIPATARPGPHYVLACADDTRSVAESSEANNCGSSATTVRILGPDLKVTAVMDPPDHRAAGESFETSDTVQNAGSAAALASVTRFYLSLDDVKQGGDSLLSGDRPVPALAPGQANAGSITLTVPSVTAAGEYYLLACADGTSVVAEEEEDEADNCKASMTRITIQLPDLVTSNLSVDPTAIAPGAAFTVSETVVNNGDAAAGPSTTRFYVSRDAAISADDLRLAETRPVDALAPAPASSSGSTTLRLPAQLAVVDYHLLACADDLRAVDEADEGNNCTSSGAPLPLVFPDLVVSSLTGVPPEMTPWAVMDLEVVVKNQGQASSRPCTTSFYLSRDASPTDDDIVLLSSLPVPELAPDESTCDASPCDTVAVTIPAQTPLDTYFVLACADGAGRITEGDETNNCWTLTQVLVGPTDLRQVMVSNPPSDILPGRSMDVTDKVENVSGALCAPSLTRFYLSSDDARDGTDRLLSGLRGVPQLTPGEASEETTSVRVPDDMSPGDYYLLACADDTLALPESDESNCEASAGMVKVLAPDLEMLAITDPPPIAVHDGSFQVTDTVRNSPDAAPAVRTLTRFYLSLDTAYGSMDLLLAGSRPVPQLEPGESNEGTIPVTVPAWHDPGEYYLLACANRDPEQPILESDPSNNCKASSSRVSLLGPDLVETEITDPPPSGILGGSFLVTDTVRNGGAAAAGPSLTRYYLSSDLIRNADAGDADDLLLGGGNSVSSLPSGTSWRRTTQVTIPVPTPPGEYYLLGCADDAATLREADEGNNCLASNGRVVVQP